MSIVMALALIFAGAVQAVSDYDWNGPQPLGEARRICGVELVELISDANVVTDGALQGLHTGYRPSGHLFHFGDRIQTTTTSWRYRLSGCAVTVWSVADSQSLKPYSVFIDTAGDYFYGPADEVDGSTIYSRVKIVPTHLGPLATRPDLP